MAEEEDDLFAAEEPVHLQQLKAIAAALQAAKNQSDSVTWVPETIPSFAHDAVKKCLEANRGTSDNQLTIITSQDAAGAADFFSDTNDSSAAPPSSHTAADSGPPTTAAASSLWSTHPLADEPQAAPQQQLTSTQSQQQAAGTAASATGPPVVLGSKHWRSGGSSKRIDWVVTTCLVPDGMPTAAAAEEGGGLAALEVVCRVLVLQDCQPAAATSGLTQALKRVRWQEFGLSYKDFYTSTAADDPTGLLTLGVLPDAVVTPLAMIVCSCVSIIPSAGLTADYTQASASSQPDAAAVKSSQPSQHIASTEDDLVAHSAADASGSNPRKRKRGTDPHNPTGFGGPKRRKGTNHNAASMQLPKLSTKREKEMYVASFEAALTALKQQLPVGYLQGKLEALLTTCLPSVSGSLANILMRVFNPSIREDACQKLNCQPLQLQEQLLTRLQTAAADAIAAKSQLAASRKQQQQTGGRRTGASAAAAAAAVAACAGDGMGGAGCESEVQQQQVWVQGEHQIQDSHGDNLQQQSQHQWQQLPEHEQQQGVRRQWEQDWPVRDQQQTAGQQWADMKGVHQQQAGPQHQQQQQHEEGPWQQQGEEAEEDPWQQEHQGLADQQQLGLAMWQHQELTGPAAAQAALQPEHLSSQWDKAVARRLPTILDGSMSAFTGPQVAHEVGSAWNLNPTVPGYLTSDCNLDEACGGSTAGDGWLGRESGSAAQQQLTSSEKANIAKDDAWAPCYCIGLTMSQQVVVYSSLMSQQQAVPLHLSALFSAAGHGQHPHCHAMAVARWVG